MNTENAKEFFKDLVFRKMESSETHNIFTNYNNFSRDFFVFEQTFEECWKVMELVQKDAEHARAMRDIYAKKAYAKEPAIIAINKQQDSRLNRYMMILTRKYEDALKRLGVSSRPLRNEASEEFEKRYPSEEVGE